MMRRTTVVAAAFLLFCALAPAALAIRVLSDKDVERISQQWDKDHEHDDDDDPRVRRMRGEGMGLPMGPDGRPDPAQMMQAESRKTKMLFVNIDAPSPKEAEDISGRLQQMLANGNIPVQRYMIEDTKAIFVVEDGGNAAEVLVFLLKQPEVIDVELDQKNHKNRLNPKGRAAIKAEREASKKPAKTSSTQKKKTIKKKGAAADSKSPKSAAEL